MTDSEKLKQLEAENTRLKEKITDFKQLEEDLLADKVFKKAKEKLVTWYTIGGISLFVIGIVGVKSIVDYSKELVSKKLDTFSQAKINEIIVNESHKQVEILLVKQTDTLTKQFQVLYDNAKKRLDLSKYGYGTTDKFDTSQTVSSQVDLTSVDLSSEMNPIRSTDAEASDVGFSIADALGHALYQKDKVKVVISPRYIYNNINHKTDAGAFITDGFNFLVKTGAIEERAWPYKAGEYALEPPASAINARHFKISSWKAIKVDLQTFKNYLSNGTCIVAGMTVYQSLYNSKNGVYATPKNSDQIVGGISVCIVGYNDKNELLKFRISWSASWGDKGYGYIKYADISKIIGDAYIITL